MPSSTDNLIIGKGIVSFALAATPTTFVDLGNCPELEWTPELETLEHFSSREGVRTRDKTVILEKKATIRFILEEWTEFNLELAFLGTTTATVIDLFAQNAIAGVLKFEGTNEVGPKYELLLPNVSIIPSGSGIGFISDEWGQLELNAEVGVDETGSFGTLTPIV